MKTYRVLMSESVAKWVEVKAGSEEEAIKKLQRVIILMKIYLMKSA